MEDGFFEGSGLPFMLVNVPAGTTPVEQERVENRFRQIFNAMRNPREIKTIAVREGVTIQVLSFTPNDLALVDTVARHRQAILGRMQVPESVVMSNAANYATAMSDKLGFAETMAQRLEDIAEVFNGDPDIMKAGVTLDIRRNEMPVMQEEETQRAQAFSLLVGAGLHPEAVMAILGFDMPENYEGPLLAQMAQQPAQDGQGEAESMPQGETGITEKQVLNGAQIRSALDIIDAFNRGAFPRDNALVMMQTFFNIPRAMATLMVPDTPGAVQESEPPIKAVEMERLHRFIENGTYLKRMFTSDVLTPDEIEREILAYEWREYP
jgi:hypothetical protein